MGKIERMPPNSQPPELDQTRAPFFDSLVSTRQRDPVSFHMPGHKFNRELPAELTDFFGAGVVTGDLVERLRVRRFGHGNAGSGAALRRARHRVRFRLSALLLSAARGGAALPRDRQRPP